MEGFSGFFTQDAPQLVAAGGAIVGQIVHIVKKKTEETSNGNGTEAGVFRRWVLKRPINTLAAAITAIGLALGLQADGLSLFQTFMHALVAGFAANSAVNRPGE